LTCHQLRSMIISLWHMSRIREAVKLNNNVMCCIVNVYRNIIISWSVYSSLICIALPVTTCLRLFLFIHSFDLAATLLVTDLPVVWQKECSALDSSKYYNMICLRSAWQLYNKCQFYWETIVHCVGTIVHNSRISFVRQGSVSLNSIIQWFGNIVV